MPVLGAHDLAVWHQLLDPDSPHFLGRRTDLAALSARSIHLGQAATPGVSTAGREAAASSP
jgi:hypothetical protein